MKINTLASLAQDAGQSLPAVPARRAIEVPSEEAIFRGWLHGAPTDTGIAVSEYNALSYIPVLACTRVISETWAMLPLKVFSADGPAVAPSHYLYSILHDLPNPEMTHFSFWEAAGVSLCLFNRFYAEIERNQAGRVKALWPLLPDRVQKKRIKGSVWYEYTTDSGPVMLPSERVLDIPGCLTINGSTTESLIKYAREAIGLGLAPEKFQANFYKNNARPGMYMTFPNTLSPETRRVIASQWDQIHAGIQGAGRTGVLEGGGKIETPGIPQKDAEFTPTRMTQLRMICAMYRVPPHKVGDLERATFSNIEEQNIQFAIDCIAPYCARAAEALNWKVVGLGSGYYAEFVLAGLMKGNLASRVEALSKSVQNALMTPNEARAVENMPPIEGGDRLYIQGATVPLEDAGKQLAGSPASDSGGDQ